MTPFSAVLFGAPQHDGGPSRLFRNDSDTGRSFLDVRLHGRAPDTEAIDARVYVGTGGVRQMRELRAGCNYVSQDPAEAHFGLATHATADELRVVWPDGAATVQLAVGAGWCAGDGGYAFVPARDELPGVDAGNVAGALVSLRGDVDRWSAEPRKLTAGAPGEAC